MHSIFAIVGALSLSHAALAGYIIEIDTDGMDDNILTFNTGFNFGGDTSTASASAGVTAFGTTGGDSIFGGDGAALPDTYVYAYSPVSQADNLVIPAGTDLGEGDLATGLTGGGFGTYRVFALWPETSNVSGGLVNYEVIAPGDTFQVDIDQNNRGNAWVLLGEIEYTGGVITVTQRAGSNTFISMRAYGVLFERVPSPGAASLLGIAGLGAMRRRR